MNKTLASGLTQIAVGAAVGFPFALTVDNPQPLRAIGIRSPRRLRQLHLDLIMMGGLVTTAALVPGSAPAARAAVAIGGWTNALSFLPLAINEDVQQHRAYRAAVTASFLLTSAGWAALAIGAFPKSSQA